MRCIYTVSYTAIYTAISYTANTLQYTLPHSTCNIRTYTTHLVFHPIIPDMSTYNIPPIAGDNRLTVFPIGRQDIWDMVKTAQKTFWVAQEIDFSRDRQDYERRLTADERQFVDYILAFFACGDKLVNINLADRFKRDVPILEVEFFYDQQMAIENVHAETYALQLDTIVPSAARRAELLDAMNTNPSIKALTDWIRNCTSSAAPFAERLLGMACVEGIFFSGCFCAIYWLQNSGKMPGLAHANELIARDEGLHTEFALLLYTKVSEPLPIARVHEIFRNAVLLAKNFTAAAMPRNLAEMNTNLMSQYIENVADGLLQYIGLPKLYNTPLPFSFMKQLSLENRTNFFERRVSEYSKTGESSNANDW